MRRVSQTIAPRGRIKPERSCLIRQSGKQPLQVVVCRFAYQLRENGAMLKRLAFGLHGSDFFSRGGFCFSCTQWNAATGKDHVDLACRQPMAEDHLTTSEAGRHCWGFLDRGTTVTKTQHLGLGGLRARV